MSITAAKNEEQKAKEDMERAGKQPSPPIGNDVPSKQNLPSMGLAFRKMTLAKSCGEGEFSAPLGRTIAIAVSDLKTGEKLTEWAGANLIRPDHDRILLFHVRPYLYPPDTYLTPALVDIGGVWDFDDTYEITNRKIAHKTLAYLKRALSSRWGVRNVVPLALRGDARVVLEEKAVELGAELMIVGTRELSGLTRLWEGSVGDHLLHHLDCPLIVIR